MTLHNTENKYPETYCLYGLYATDLGVYREILREEITERMVAWESYHWKNG